MFVGGDHIPRRLLASTADAPETSVMQLHRIKTILDLHKASLIYIYVWRFLGETGLTELRCKSSAQTRWDLKESVGHCVTRS